MIDYIGRFVSSVSEALEFNQATLSGCIDVIVIEQEDGTHMCTPFHVRFGKLKVLKSKEKVVTINVNGKDADFKMKLGAAGDGFFEEKRDLRLNEEIMSDSQSDPENYMSSEDDSEITSPRREGENGSELKDDPRRDKSNGKQAKKWGWLWKSTPDDVIQPEKEKEDEMKHAIERLLEDQLGSAKESEKIELLHDIEEGPSRGTLIEENEASKEKRPFELEKDQQTISEIVAEHNQNIHNENIEKNIEKNGEKNGEHHEIHPHPHDHEHKHIPEHMSRFSPQTQAQAHPHELTHTQSETAISNLAPIVEQDQEQEQGQGQIKTQTPVKEKDDELDPEKKKKKRGIIRSFLSMFKSEGEIKLPNNDRKTVSSTATVQIKKTEKEVKNDKKPDEELLSFPEAIENVDFNIDDEEKREPAKEKLSDATEFPPDADIELSLCGNYIDEKEHEDLTTIFLKHRVPFSKFLKDPFQVLSNQNLMVKIDDKLYDWKTACPLVISLLAYKRPLPEEVLQDLAARESTKSSSSWKDWFSSSKKEEKPKKDEKGVKSDKKDQKESKDSKDKKEKDQKEQKEQKGKSEAKETKEIKKPEEKVYAEEAKHEEIHRPDGIVDPPTVRDEKPPMITEKQIIRENLAQEKMLAKSGEIDVETSTRRGKVRRTLRPNSDMLKTLNLKPGCNTISYTVHGGIQGEQTLTANIYLWPANVKIVISDIDGTITKSDVLGQLMPMMGRDWSQPGVTSLYSNIRKNGYQILYLTARAIGQSQLTKNFLNSLTQEGYSLPPGPVILSPDRLVPSFKREIIYRKPEVFKIACLRDLRSLFAPNHNPFYAGFGNRETDAIAYQAVGVPSGKIFTINTVGEIRLLNATYSKSYVLINDMVHDMFPGIEVDDKYLASEEYNLVNYFKVNYETLIDFDVSELIN